MAKKKRKKNKNLGPKRKRYTRQARLLNAPSFIEDYEGKSIVKGYSKWFGVSRLCAVKELEMLGHSFSDHYKNQLKEMEHQKQKAAENRKKRRKEEQLLDYDDDFGFVAGYTSGGAPFGLSWEEIEEIEKREIEEAERELVETTRIENFLFSLAEDHEREIINVMIIDENE